MGVDLADSRRERSDEMRDQDDPPMRERWGGGYEDMEENVSDELRESGKYRSKDKSKSSGQKEDKEHRSRDREKAKSQILKETEKESKDLEKERVSSRDRRKEDRDERGKDKTRDKVREKDADHDKNRDKERDKDRKDRGKEKERDKVLEKDGERGRDKEGVKDKSREKVKDRERTKERGREKEREKHKDRERERERENERDMGKEAVEREKGKERTREKEKLADQDKERARDRDRDRSSRKHKDESRDRNKDLEKDDNSRLETNYSHDKHITQEGMDYFDEDNSKGLKTKQSAEAEGARSLQPASELEDRILKIREERLKKKSEGGSEVLSWVDKSRKLEEKRNAEKEKALQLSKIFEEQDNINGESDDEAAPQHYTENLGGVKILHGLDKVLEGGAVVLTLKDQSILADGDINQEIDMLENVEMGEQKRRDEAYKAAKKKTGIYDDKFNDELDAEKKILPQYDDPVADEGATLDASGRFTGEAEKKLEELRKRLQGVSTTNNVQDLNSTGKISTDYYTQEEMLKFKKPKKTKSLRKKEKLDLDALEAEAISAGLGAEDLGSRNDGRRRNLREQQEKSEAEMRSNSYQSAYARADEASKALQQGKTQTMKPEEDDAPEFDDDDDELWKSLERARKLSLKKQDEKEKFGPQVIAQLSTSSFNDLTANNQNSESVEPQENKVVFTEMEEFVWGLQLDEEAQKSESGDVFMDEDVAPSTSDQEKKDEGYWTEVEETIKDETPAQEKEVVVPDISIHESAVGKGLAGALKLLKDRGTLKETVEWGGRNTDKKKSKLVGIYDDDSVKEIRIERTDECGRILTPKEDFRLLSHKFHGKWPGKTKQEKRMRQYQEELKIKQMKNADTPSLSVERMREAQAQLKTPYLVLGGHVKPGQTSDPRSSFATVEDLTGGLTPMLGDKKVEHFLNIKRKSEPEHSVSHKKPKT